MGRKRRDQRDAIRKQRAKRRKKNDSSGDANSDDEQPILSGVASRRAPEARGSEAIADQKEADPSTESGDKKISKAGDRESKPEPSSSVAKVEDTTDQSKVSASKKPVDKIERMRLKKQQQKARRKEKKAAREAAVSATSK